MVPWSVVRLAVMLQIVAPYVAEMLHLKSLTINRVAGVTGFQSISPCKSNIKSFINNILACVFGCFSNAPFTPNSDFCTSRFVPCRARLGALLPALLPSVPPCLRGWSPTPFGSSATSINKIKPPRQGGTESMSTDDALLICRTVFARRGRFLMPFEAFSF